MILKNVKKQTAGLLKNPLCWIVVFAAIVFLFLILSILYYSMQKGLSDNADSIGSTIGSIPGKAVGMAVGSFEGWEEGKNIAVENPEISVDIKTRLHEVGKLEILNVSAKGDNFTTEKDHAKYQVVVFDVVYSIDLQQASFSEQDDQFVVTIPKPAVEMNYNEKNTKVLFESASSFWNNGSAQYGWNAGVNARKKLLEDSENSFRNDEKLMQQAMDTGIREVANFVNNIKLDKTKKVIVQYKDEEK